nr:hypothetical protein [Tanacetum cinerariifolium]
MIAHQETIHIVKDKAYAAQEAWAHSIGLSQAVHSELQTHQEQDEKDPKEDPVDYPADRGNINDNKSSNDDDDDDDVEKDEEDKEEEEYLASADPSDVSTDDLETMTTVNQGMNVEEIKRVVAQRVANAIEAIVIYETKTNLARKSMSQTERKEEEEVENASNKRKWERMSVEKIERVVAQRVANAIEAIAIYETKTNLARKSMSQTERQEEKAAENASNKRK